MLEVTERELVLKKEGDYWIEENVNYPPNEANVFLMRTPTWEMQQRPFAGGMLPRNTPRCIGGAGRYADGVWRANVNKIAEEESGDDDALIVYEGESREQAIEALWARRFDAYCY